MEYNPYNPTPVRRSLGCIGILDEYDLLAGHLRWLRYARYIREDVDDTSSSVCFLEGEAHEDLFLPPVSMALAHVSPAVAHDLMYIGALFDEGRMMGYPYARELDMRG
ncbi:hypothetical protein GQ44DRAFT_774898 [Phaeosphaeriaceae sp. PMI808]|nr:hypothetical protein GQ44DRAFT_774898 [Phaeosphaeriaceae sp. PMI808]